MPIPVNIRVRWYQSRWVAISIARYNRAAVEHLKEVLFVRAFDPGTREWLCPEWALADVVREFGSITLDGVPPQHAQDPRYSVLSVHRDAPDCVIKAAYKALAFELHPDRNHGATGEEMKQLNATFQTISKERGF